MLRDYNSDILSVFYIILDSPAKPGIRIAVDDTMNVQYQPYYTPEKLQMDVPKKGYKGIKNAATHKDTPKEAPKIEPPTDVPGIASKENYNILLSYFIKNFHFLIML